MEIYKLQQLWVFFMCAVSGGACGFVYDAMQTLHQCFGTTKKSLAISDIIFWIIASVIVYATIYLTNNADLRWHELIGLLSGIILYMLYLSRYIKRTLSTLFTFFGKILKKFFRLICIPIRLVHILSIPLFALWSRIKTRALYLIYNTSFQLRRGFFTKIVKFRKK